MDCIHISFGHSQGCIKLFDIVPIMVITHFGSKVPNHVLQEDIQESVTRLHLRV